MLFAKQRFAATIKCSYNCTSIMCRIYEILYYVYAFMIMYNTYFKTNVFCKLLAIQLAFSISI